MRPQNGIYNFDIYDSSGTDIASLMIVSLDTPGMLMFKNGTDTAALLRFIDVPTASVPAEQVQWFLDTCPLQD